MTPPEYLALSPTMDLAMVLRFPERDVMLAFQEEYQRRLFEDGDFRAAAMNVLMAPQYNASTLVLDFDTNHAAAEQVCSLYEVISADLTGVEVTFVRS